MLHRLDIALLRLMRTHAHAPPVERAVVRFSALGEHAALWYVTAAAGAALDRRRRGLYLRLTRTLLLTQALNTLTKLAIRRARPLLEGQPALSPTVTSLSYPSAHASTSFAAASVLSASLPRAPLYACAAAMALSRPYLGVHYPSDTLGGCMLGVAVARLAP